MLDVKVGSGAFMTERGRAAELAAAMVEIGRSANMKVAALLTAMDVPLGRAVGNAVEVDRGGRDARGQWPGRPGRRHGGTGRSDARAGRTCPGDPRRALQDGSALAVWREMVRAQGGDPDAPLPVAGVVEPVLAERDGFLARLEARSVGVAAWRLGAGRAKKEDPVLASAGVRCLVKPGEPVTKGQTLPRTAHRRPGPPGARERGAARRGRSHRGGTWRRGPPARDRASWLRDRRRLLGSVRVRRRPS